MIIVLKSWTNILKLDKIRIEGFCFFLHYKMTAAIFFLASLLTSTDQIFGSPIVCTKIASIPQDVIDNYCWMHETYSIPTKWSGVEGKHWPQPGIGPDNPNRPDDVRTHTYYQWVFFVLILQGVSFLIPNFIWKAIEDGKIESLAQKNLQTPVPDKEVKAKELDRIVDYWKNHRGMHTKFALTYFACELLNLINTVGQIYFTDLFLGNQFSTYGFDVAAFIFTPSGNRNDPMTTVFPKTAKCTFRQFGPSGNIERHDSLCVLPINVVNEKIYVVIWFWLILLGVATLLYLIYVVKIICFSRCRIALLASKTAQPNCLNDVQAVLASRRLTWLQKLSDWLLLYMLFRNLDTLSNSDIIKRICESSRKKNSLPVPTLTVNALENSNSESNSTDTNETPSQQQMPSLYGVTSV